jgi:hypothetical protein
MRSEFFLQLVQLGTILVGLVGLAMAMRRDRRQMHAQMYLEFSSRFHDMLRTLPTEIWKPPAASGEQLPPRDEELTKSCLQCFHLMADLYHLHQGGYLTAELWRPWQRGIKRAMQRPLLQREWLFLEGNFDHEPGLCRYMRRLITDRSNGPKHWRSLTAAPGDFATAAVTYRKLLFFKSHWPHSVCGGRKAPKTGDAL